MKRATVYAKHKSARISPKKVKPVMDLVRGKDTYSAKALLALDNTKAAKMVLKVIRSAESNARNNMNIDPENMYVSDIQVGSGAMMKRANFGGRGRFSTILKRSSHIIVGLSERNEK